MGGIASKMAVSPSVTSIVGTSINTTSVAAAVTITYQDKPAVAIYVTNNSSTPVSLVRQPITINGQGTTVAGTAILFDIIGTGLSQRYEVGAHGVAFGPAVWKVFAAAAPASGTFVLITVPNK